MLGKRKRQSRGGRSWALNETVLMITVSELYEAALREVRTVHSDQERLSKVFHITGQDRTFRILCMLGPCACKERAPPLSPAFPFMQTTQLLAVRSEEGAQLVSIICFD